jgi:hypothetical protein
MGPRKMSVPGRDDRLTRYLLGTLPEGEAEQVERDYFSGDEAFEAMQAAEDELYFEYAEGALSTDDRRRFEERYLQTTEDRQRLAETRVLLAGAARGRAAAPRAWLAAAAAILLAALLWVVIPPADEERSAAGGGGPRPSLPVDPQAPRLTLTRTEEPPRVYLPPTARRLELAVDIDGYPAGTWKAALRSSEGKLVWEHAGVGASEGALRLHVPAAALDEDDYVLALTRAAATPLEYRFVVLRD